MDCQVGDGGLGHLAALVAEDHVVDVGTGRPGFLVAAAIRALEKEPPVLAVDRLVRQTQAHRAGRHRRKLAQRDRQGAAGCQADPGPLGAVSGPARGPHLFVDPLALEGDGEEAGRRFQAVQVPFEVDGTSVGFDS